jgi:Uma2 family endonuclease
MATQPKPRLTPEQYLEIERKADHKSEYLDGEMYAMSGGTRRHSLIAANINAALHAQLRGKPCNVFTSDLRVLVKASGLYAYPDVSVACGEVRVLDGADDVLLNPTLIVEVLSPSTEAYDRGRKFEHYRNIESLCHYLLVASDRVQLELFTRQSDRQWLLTTAANPEEQVALPSIGCTVLVSEVYEKVDLSEA